MRGHRHRTPRAGAAGDHFLSQAVDGASLVPLVTLRSRREPGPAYLESYHPRLWWGARELIGLRTGDWLFIQSPRPELYDVERDPLAAVNLASRSPQELERWAGRLEHEYAAPLTAAFVREALAVYGERGLLAPSDERAPV